MIAAKTPQTEGTEIGGGRVAIEDRVNHDTQFSDYQNVNTHLAYIERN